jgi:hypothetical protein
MYRIAPLRRARKHLFVSACFIATATAFAAKSDSVPEWVRTAAAQKLPSYPAETNAVVLFEDTTYTVTPDGTATEHYRAP